MKKNLCKLELPFVNSDEDRFSANVVFQVVPLSSLNSERVGCNVCLSILYSCVKVFYSWGFIS
jgi:hypothetical protein